MSETSPIPGLIVASPASGVGKTTVALGIMRALCRRGHSVQPFKSGPDYIDPAFHNVATGRQSINLDTWAMSRNLMSDFIENASTASQIIIAEGAMGLFDGAATSGISGNGSTADLAAATGWPVLLVIDASKQAQTAAAIALGCQNFRADVSIAGVILNRVASPRHESLIRDALVTANLKVLGTLPRSSDVTLPERHLGLVQAQESSSTDDIIERLADRIEIHADLDGMIAAASSGSRMPTEKQTNTNLLPPPGQRIALAQDDAFSFVYPHIVNHWRRQGATILPFSPLKDQPPDVGADSIWLPGGYPELHAEKLANAANFKNALRKCANSQVPIHGECGGYMVLGEAIKDANGKMHEMAGLLSHITSFADRSLHLGYRRAKLLAPSALGTANTILFGHEYHYATLQICNDTPLAETFDANGKRVSESGSRRGFVSGTFFHVVSQASP